MCAVKELVLMIFKSWKIESIYEAIILRSIYEAIIFFCTCLIKKQLWNLIDNVFLVFTLFN